MNVRVVVEVLAPGVKDGKEADLGPHVTRIACDGGERFRDRPEEHLVEGASVLQGKRSNLLGESEDHVEVRNLEQVFLAIGKPLRPGATLAFAAVTIAA